MSNFIVCLTPALPEREAVPVAPPPAKLSLQCPQCSGKRDNHRSSCSNPPLMMLPDVEPEPAPLPIPEALYSCKHCREDYSWPAADLFWSDREKAWVCTECWDHEGHGQRGTTLQAEIMRQAK
jgi:hypothetical protein